MRTRSGCSIPDARHTSANSYIRSRIAIAMLTQASASALTPRDSGSPKNIRMASPMYLSIVAPWANAISDICDRY